MAKGLKVEAKGLEVWLGTEVEQTVYDAVKECMDDIRDDFRMVSLSLVPRKTGKLEESQYVRRYYKNLEKIYFTVSYKGINDGFDYAEWTHDADYNLGAISRTKRPARSRFAKGTLKVGKGYMSQVQEASEDAYAEFINQNIARKLDALFRSNSGK